ncbi:WYL domain-containing protein [Corynebacterium sp. sy039]|nr:WYL domain-containing protein [Corynebacterium sp. sy039]
MSSLMFVHYYSVLLIPAKREKTVAKSYKKLEDLVRMLNLIPYFKAHPGRSVMEAAADLGMQNKQLLEDLNSLFCCGPGSLPDELVDMDSSFRAVEIINSQGMDQPLRLTQTEAGALLLSLEYLESVPGLVDASAVRSAAHKLRQAMGDDVSGVFDTKIATDTSTEIEKTMGTIQEAMMEHKQIIFDYLPADQSKEKKQRVVSPIRIFTHDLHSYLCAWEDSVADTRNFRLDRIHHVEISDDKAKNSSDFNFDDSDPFGYAAVATQATLIFHDHAVWLADTIPGAFGNWERYQGKQCYVVQVPIISQQWLVQFLLSNAKDVYAIEPSSLLDAVRKQAHQGLAAYNGA